MEDRATRSPVGRQQILAFVALTFAILWAIWWGMAHTSINLAAFGPAAVGSTGAASFLYAIVTWIVALVIVFRFGRANLASRPPVTVDESTGRPR